MESLKFNPSDASTIKAMINQYGFDSMCYVIRPHDLNNPLSMIKKLSKPFNQYVKNEKYALCLDERSKLIRQHYYSFLATKSIDEMIKLSPYSSFWTGHSNVESMQKIVAQFKNANNFNCSLHVRLPLDEVPEWSGTFILFSDQEAQSTLASMKDNYKQLETQLMLLNYQLLNQYYYQLTPLINYACISEKSSEILSLLSEDVCIDDISNTLHISARGVGYHIDRLKDLFEVKTRAALIKQGIKYGIVKP
ncbi:hypothetical protein [Shewanella sp. TC10]|uniref:hypothetical protein n=1 Tax=Shewanella sp. TC10 TaxID=1419739 RepID=UPI00129E2DA2|nr:hypothetical protein [Shewanella sp. TC10]